MDRFKLLSAKSMSIDDRDNLFIADAGNKRILELSPRLTHVFGFGKEGDSLGQFRNPKSIAVTKDSRYLYVYDSGKRKIAKFKMIRERRGTKGGILSEEIVEIVPMNLILFSPRPNPTRRIAIIKYGVPKQERVSLMIYDIVGRQVKKLVNQIHKPGFYTVTWDGEDNRGKGLPAGIYFCLLKDREKIISKKIVLVR